MSFYIKNNVLITDKNLISELENRMFKYSDGFFETCLIEERNISYWGFHLTRMQNAFKILQFDILNFDQLKNNILKLHSLSGHNTSKINIYFWRESEGLYTPQSSSVNYYVSLKEFSHKPSPIKSIGISKDIKNYYSVFSFFKSGSLKYVLAGLEKKKNTWDDIIILDHEGNLSECLSSNLFWIKDGEYFTPSIQTGCIDGVYRNYLIDKLLSEGKKVNIGFWKSESLNTADEIFCTNIIGVRKIIWNK